MGNYLRFFSHLALVSYNYVVVTLSWLFRHVCEPFWLHVVYFVALSILGTLVLHVSPTRTSSFLGLLDAFYTSVSATTVSSLEAVPMEILSEFQLLVLTFLMFVGGEVFTSMLCLHIKRFLHGRHHSHDKISLEFSPKNSFMSRKKPSIEHGKEDQIALTYLGYLSLMYLMVVQLGGILIIIAYLSIDREGHHILGNKDIRVWVFTLFSVISSFANCGFIPFNDNLMPFRKSGFMLFVLGGQIVLGNTLYAPTLWALLWTIKKFSRNNGNRYDYILKNGWRLYEHLFPSRVCLWLIITVLSFLALQVTLLCGLHWNSELFEGFNNAWQKIVAAIFQCVAIRHAGENVVDPQLLSSAIVVVYVVMMYLPGYPLEWSPQEVKEKASSISFRTEFGRLLVHDASYLTMAVIVISITERHRVLNDPLNFKVLNIMFEVASGYGNVGISIGYSCLALQKVAGPVQCKDVPVSFSGKWSPSGKFVIIFVMFFGRLKTVRRNSLYTKWIQNDVAMYNTPENTSSHETELAVFPPFSS